MVAPERDHAWQRLSMLTHALHLSVRGRLAHEDTVMAVFYLLDGKSIVVGRQGNISTVNDGRPAVERIRG